VTQAVVIGGGLAGTEAALTLARLGLTVKLYEMRPLVSTPAHESDLLGELVCSNSLRSDSPDVAPGLLKRELRLLSSPLLDAADLHAVPAGSALAVNRTDFAAELTRRVMEHPFIELVREEVTRLPESELTILAPGPLCSAALMEHLAGLVGSPYLFFFDAIAPIVAADSLNMEILFRQSRYDRGEGDYLNAPMSEDEYFAFVKALVEAEEHEGHAFENPKNIVFTGCEPIEAIASRGVLSLAHGPMRPVGLKDFRTGRRPFAVVQLRTENKEGTSYNLVGFQTRLRRPEQLRVFRLIPGLENAEFLRFGSIHRNSYLDSPRLVNPDLSLRMRPNVFVAGQFCGSEGYIESIATGTLAALFLANRAAGREMPMPPAETALGGLLRHVTSSLVEPLQPSNVHFGLLPPLKARGGKVGRREAMSERAQEAMALWLQQGPSPTMES